MSIKTFFKLVEIQTKLASLFPFLIGTLFVMNYYGHLNILNTLVFFGSMLAFDMTTTAINNYMDYTKATSDEYRKNENIIGQKNIPERLVIAIIFTLLTIAIILGLYLVYLTNLLVLIIGLICFAIGVFYTFGPIPISRMPLGEVFSGLTMGFGIVFLIVYVNAYDKGIIDFVVQGQYISLEANIVEFAKIILVSLPCVFTIAAVMLANNICDLEQDIENKRYTLPYYIGKRRGIILFNTLYIGTFVAILFAVFLKLMPTFTLLTFIVIYPVYENVRRFNEKQIKAETFPVAIKNMVLVNGAIVAMLSISLML